MILGNGGTQDYFDSPTRSRKIQKYHSNYTIAKLDEQPAEPVFIELHLFRKSAGETEKRRKIYQK